MANAVTKVPTSTPFAGTEYLYGPGIAHVDGTTVNTITLTGLPLPDVTSNQNPIVYQNPNGIIFLSVRGTHSGSAGYNPATLLTDPTNPTQATVDVYVTGDASTIIQFLVY